MLEEPLERLKGELQNTLKALGQNALDSVSQRVNNATDSLNDAASNGGVITRAAAEGGKAMAEGESPAKGALKGGLTGIKDKVKNAVSGSSGGGRGALKSTNIVETIDVGVPIDVAYDQWTQFQDFPTFMKKVENVNQEEDTKLTWKAQVLWSHRSWNAQIVEQVPNDRIVWRSEGEKGHVDGAVTFHELAPNLTRILVVLEYYPQGFMERTGNIWRAQGRRARLELKHFRRHVMTRTILDTEELEGWRGEIHDGEVTRGPDEEPEDEYESDEEGESEEDYEPEDEYDEEDEYEAEEEPEEEPEEEGEEPQAEYEEEDGYEEEPEEEEPEEEPEEQPRRRTARSRRTA
jgi:uncharacterized membrane protein